MSHGNGSPTPQSLNRRDFLATMMAGVSGSLMFSDPTQAAELGAELPTVRIRVQRDLDLLALQFTFVNFREQHGNLLALGNGRSLIVVRFPAQNLAEAVFNVQPPATGFENAPLPVDGQPGSVGVHSNVPPVASYLSGPSWIVFVVPDDVRLPFRRRQRGGSAPPTNPVDSWLRMMADWKIRVPRNAIKPGRPSMPKFDETCLEIPFRLFIAPTSEETRWLTSSERLWGVDPPRDDRRELWHAALHSRRHIRPAQLPPDITNLPAELGPPTRITVQARAVYSPDYQVAGEPGMGEYYPGVLPLSLGKSTRHRLVKQMALGDGWIDAEHLILSPLGCDASLSYLSQRTFQEILDQQLSGNDGGQNLSIWKHRIVVGRDVYFAEVRMGFLFPFVYPSLAVEITRRTFTPRAHRNGHYSAPGAYLLKERFLLVQDPLKQFPDSGSSIGRKMPLKRVLLTQTTSPLLADWEKLFPVLDDCDANSPVLGELSASELEGIQSQDPQKRRTYFIPRPLTSQGNPGADGLRWPMEFEDEAGQKSTTADACLLFAQNVVVGRKLWQALRPQFRRWSLPAQKIALAPDRAEISVLATAETTNAKQQTVQAGQTLFQHVLGNEEREAARVLAELLQGGGQSFHAFQKFVQGTGNDVDEFLRRTKALAREIKEKAGATEDEVIEFEQLVTRQVQGLRAETIRQLSECVDTIQRHAQSTADFVDGAYEELLRQLNRAEQVTSTLETHVLAFDSTIVRDVYQAAETRLQDIANAAQTANDFVQALSTLTLEHEGQAWKQRMIDEAKRRVNGLTGSAALAEVKAYAAEMKNAALLAKKQANSLFNAQLAQAEVVVPALKAMAADAPAKAINLLDDYVSKGMGQLGAGLSRVQNGAFAALEEKIDQGAEMADKVRSAVARPAAVIAGLSRDLGALTGDGPDAIQKLANQVTSVEALKPTIDDLKKAIPDAKLFSVLPLREIIKAAAGLNDLARGQLPNINLVTLPDHYEQVWEWTTDVDSKDFGILKFKTEPPQGKYRVALHISSVNRVNIPKVDPRTIIAKKPIDTKLRGRTILRGFLGYWDEQGKRGLDDNQQTAFHLTILGLIDVAFRSVEFNAEGDLGQTPSPKVTPHMGPIEFLGPLKFVKNLQAIIASLLGDNFRLEITPEDITVGFAMPLPAISFGAVSIRNISVGTALVLSFTNKPLAFRFNFATFKQPFEVAVMCFGGRGFFQAQLATDGSRDLQGAIEFGGVLAFDVTVAGGDLYVMAGFYFRLTNSQTDLSGYIRAGGNLHVLGLIHASVEFLLAGRYRKEESPGKIYHQIYGVCSVTVNIDLFLFSKSVEITFEKKLAGSSESASESTAYSRHRRLHLASLSRKAPTPDLPERIPHAYFERDWRDVPGRFAYDPRQPAHSVRTWDEQYWSHFAFDEFSAGA